MKTGITFTSCICTCLMVLAAGLTSVAQSELNESELVPRTVFVLQDYVDDFDHGLRAGGKIIGVGEVLGSVSLVEAEGRDNGGGNTTAIRLSTDDIGFQADQQLTNPQDCVTSVKKSFIGVIKEFEDLDNDGDPDPINVKGPTSKFNAISYFVRNDSDNSTSPIEAELQLVIGDGGNVCAGDGLSGSTWKQKIPTPLADATDWKRRVLQLDNFDFERVQGPAKDDPNAEDHENLGNVLDQITAVTVVVNANGEISSQSNPRPRSIYIDDINFFNNDKVLKVTQSKVFSKAGTGDTITITATVVDHQGQPQSGIKLQFTVQDGTGIIGGNGCVVTNASGEASVTYTVSNALEITEITVVEDSGCTPVP